MSTLPQRAITNALIARRNSAASARQSGSQREPAAWPGAAARSATVSLRHHEQQSSRTRPNQPSSSNQRREDAATRQTQAPRPPAAGQVQRARTINVDTGVRAPYPPGNAEASLDLAPRGAGRRSSTVPLRHGKQESPSSRPLSQATQISSNAVAGRSQRRDCWNRDTSSRARDPATWLGPTRSTAHRDGVARVRIYEAEESGAGAGSSSWPAAHWTIIGGLLRVSGGRLRGRESAVDAPRARVDGSVWRCSGDAHHGIRWRS